MAVTSGSRLRASALLCAEDDLNEMEYSYKDNVNAQRCIRLEVVVGIP